MVIWGIDDATQGRSMIARPAGRESADVLGDARSWGFDHGVRQPRPGPAANTFPVR